VRRLLVTASVVPSSPILVTLMKEALSSAETSVLTRDTILEPTGTLAQAVASRFTDSATVAGYDTVQSGRLAPRRGGTYGVQSRKAATRRN
jgi:hypothetical protein